MIVTDKDGTIYMYRGDSGELVFKGLDESKSCTVCLAIQDKNRNLVGQELNLNVAKSDTVTFILTPDFTDLLVVPKNKQYAIYYYGVKVCDANSQKEDTLFVDNNTYGDLNRIVVYPRKVAGDVNG